MKKLFYTIPGEKREKIVRAALKEFIAHGYEQSSTNAIVKEAGIAKGTLFTYVESKEDLFISLFEEVMNELGEIQGDPAIYHSEDIFERLNDLFKAAINYYEKKPLHYFFSLKAVLDNTGSLAGRVELIRRKVSEKSVDALFQDVNWELYRLPRSQVVDVFVWLSRGLRASALEIMDLDTTMDEYREFIDKELSIVRKLLSGGVYKKT